LPGAGDVMRLQVVVVLSLFLSTLAGVSVAQTPSLKELQGAVTSSRAKADQARERLARAEARQTAAQVELRTMISGTADTHEAEQAIRDLKKAEPDLTAIKARFLEESDRHNEKLAELKTKLSELQQEKVDTSDIDRQIAAVQDDIREFDDYRARAVQELRQGYYCSQCSRPASQIVKETGKSFKQHLRDVRGRPIPMSESRISKKQEEFDRKRANLERKLKSLEDKRDRQVKQHQDKVARAQKAINKEYDDYSARRNAFEADMAKARDKHRTETRAKVGALEAKIKQTWDAHWDGIRKKQDEVSGLYDEMSRVREEIHKHKLDGMKAGFKVDRAIRHQRWEMQQKARELARERERLRRAAQAAFQADLRAKELQRLRTARSARAARERRASERFRQAMTRSGSSRYDAPRREVSNEPADTGVVSRPSVPDRSPAPQAPAPVETAGLPPSDVPQGTEPPASESQAQAPAQDRQAPPPQVQKAWQAEEAERARKELQRIERQQRELERAERAQRDRAAELARVEADRAETSRAETSAFDGLIDDTGGNYFEDVAGWAEDVKHAADSFETEVRKVFSPEENLLPDAVNELFDFASGGSRKDDGETPEEQGPSLWNQVGDVVTAELKKAKTSYRKKLNGAGESLVLGFIKSKADSVSGRVSETVTSFERQFNPATYLLNRAADVAHDGADRIFYEGETDLSYDDLSDFERKYRQVMIAGRRFTLPHIYVKRLGAKGNAFVDTFKKTFWPYDDEL
jgi:hypothetical protein